MAYPLSRSMNADLAEGMTDGSHKKVVRDRGGSVERATYEQRSSLYDVWFGIHEQETKVLPDGRIRPTPNAIYTPHVTDIL